MREVDSHCCTMSDPAERPASRESSREPQDSQQGASPTQPQWPQSTSKLPQWSPGTSTVPLWPQAASTLPHWLPVASTLPHGSQGTSTLPQWPRSAKPTPQDQQSPQCCSPSKRPNRSPQQQQTQSTTTRQQTQGTDPGRIASTRQKPQVAAAETYWRQSIRDWYPNLHGQTYFVPPSHFNRVPYDVQTVAGQSVLVPREASDQPHQVPVVFNPSGPPSPPVAAPLASRVWPDQPVPPGPLPVVYDSYTRDDRAMQQVLDCIRDLAERERLVMLVLSQLEFRKYLDNQVDPINAAAICLLRPACREGDFDVLMVNKKYGLILGEVKSVGADASKIPDLDKAVVKTVQRTVKQLNNAKAVLGQLVSDLPHIRITGTLMLPNITSTQLLHALSTNTQVQQALCQCVGEVVTDPTAAVARCLTASSLTSSQWWRRAVTDLGPDSNMTADLYEVLVARFCGPATTIEVPTITTPRRTVPLRTLSEAVALTGLTTAMLTLYPEQVELVNRPGLPRVFLWGPPGTGKTVILVIKGMQWGRQGKDVHLLSLHTHSRAAILLIERQLQHSLGGGSASTSTPTSTPTPGSRVHAHFYDFERNEGDVEAAVEELASAARDGELFAIADEAFSGRDDDNTSGRFAEFCTHLAARVPVLHLWTAAVRRDVTPACLCMETVTTPVRCPPAVVREVGRSGRIWDGSVPRYTGHPAPAPTDGPAVRWIRHWVDYGWSTLSPGHTARGPEDCEGCADHIAHLMEELRVGQTGRDLQYRDTFILCHDPRDNLPVVTRLRASGVPVQVVTSRDDEAAIRDVALAVRDAVTVTHYDVVRGLERRVVMGVGGWDVDDDERLVAMSRCTSLLVWAGPPLQSGDDDDLQSDDDDDDDDDDGMEEEDGVV